jgi:urease accessory protein
MLRLTEFASSGTAVGDTLTLTFDERRRSRFRTSLDGGREAGVWLPRGTVLHDGDCLTGDDGVVVRVRAASEEISLVRAAECLLLCRACYHLGNRHVPLQIAPGELRYRRDHVLDGLVRSLGLEIIHDMAPFEPEHGAYIQSSHGHDHSREGR